MEIVSTVAATESSLGLDTGTVEVLIASPKLESDVEYSKLVAIASEIFTENGISVKTLKSTYDGAQYVFKVN